MIERRKEGETEREGERDIERGMGRETGGEKVRRREGKSRARKNTNRVP